MPRSALCVSRQVSAQSPPGQTPARREPTAPRFSRTGHHSGDTVELRDTFQTSGFAHTHPVFQPVAARRSGQRGIKLWRARSACLGGNSVAWMSIGTVHVPVHGAERME